MGVLLVSSAKIKAFSQLNEGVDDALLLAGIQISQDIGLQTLLGTKFYNHILSAASGNTLSNQENILVQEYIQPYLIWRGVWESMGTMYYRMMNKSIIVGNTEQGNAADKSGFIYLRNIHRDRYEFYAQRLMDYIQYRPGDFPDYFSNSTLDGMFPSKENYFAGVHIGPGSPRRLPVPGIRGWADPTGPSCCVDNW